MARNEIFPLVLYKMEQIKNELPVDTELAKTKIMRLYLGF